MAAIAPIQGMLKRHLLTHLSIGIGGGLISGYAWWYTFHTPKIAIRDAWYLQHQAEKSN
ncbi:hypothetical protein BCR35DRAFT_348864 [Leucosporidium creatinivorum]|uniref:Cytochrome c oxidase subunit 9, mitochondrial n=1 Tax=Leucosporidium creatinivorum TaxID=106004 RepID=A0A1Y2G3H3_9BASI|nr:hypothetical protein BCR35DRAFT_348864 [Leucosporidium creatinivorum]